MFHFIHCQLQDTIQSLSNRCTGAIFLISIETSMKSNRKRFSPPLSPGLCSLLPLQELQQRLFILFVFWATTNSCLATQKPDPDTSCAKVRDNHDDNIEIKIIGQKQYPGLYI